MISNNAVLAVQSNPSPTLPLLDDVLQVPSCYLLWVRHNPINVRGFHPPGVNNKTKADSKLQIKIFTKHNSSIPLHDVLVDLHSQVHFKVLTSFSPTDSIQELLHYTTAKSPPARSH